MVQEAGVSEVVRERRGRGMEAAERRDAETQIQRRHKPGENRGDQAPRHRFPLRSQDGMKEDHRGQRDRHLLGEEREGEEEQRERDEGRRRSSQGATLEIEQQRSGVEGACEDIRPAGDPVDGTRVARMNGEESGGGPSAESMTEHAAADAPDEQRRTCMKEKVGQVVSRGMQPVEKAVDREEDDDERTKVFDRQPLRRPPGSCRGDGQNPAARERPGQARSHVDVQIVVREERSEQRGDER